MRQRLWQARLASVLQPTRAAATTLPDHQAESVASDLGTGTKKEEKMMTLEEFAALEAVKQVKARYCYHLDYKEWDAYADLFTKDATLDVDRSVTTRGRLDNDPQPQVRGRAAIRAFMPPLLDLADTVHQVHSPILKLVSPSEIKGIWAMEDIVRMPGFHLEGRGHYRERYVVEDGEWRIASLHLTRTWINMVEGSAEGPEDR
jgi:hypothetical protein